MATRAPPRTKKRRREQGDDDAGDEQQQGHDHAHPAATAVASESSSSVEAEEQFGCVPNPNTAGRAECRLLVYNVSKKANVGTIMRSAVAFGCLELVLVSRKGGKGKINTFGAKGTHRYLRYKHFMALDEAVAYLKDETQSDLVGVEIDAESKPVSSHPFRPGRNVCFVMGNEGDGLNDKIRAHCDYLVYIKHSGAGTASLNVACAATIVLHHFGLWAGYGETPRDGAKYVVDPSQRTGHRNPRRGVRPKVAREEGAAAAAAAAASAKE